MGRHILVLELEMLVVGVRAGRSERRRVGRRGGGVEQSEGLLECSDDGTDQHVKGLWGGGGVIQTYLKASCEVPALKQFVDEVMCTGICHSLRFEV